MVQVLYLYSLCREGVGNFSLEQSEEITERDIDRSFLFEKASLLMKVCIGFPRFIWRGGKLKSGAGQSHFYFFFGEGMDKNV